MKYDVSTLLERYQWAAELAPDRQPSDCPLCASGLPPANPEACLSRGCTLNCRGLVSVVREAIDGCRDREGTTENRATAAPSREIEPEPHRAR